MLIKDEKTSVYIKNKIEKENFKFQYLRAKYQHKKVLS